MIDKCFDEKALLVTVTAAFVLFALPVAAQQDHSRKEVLSRPASSTPQLVSKYDWPRSSSGALSGSYVNSSVRSSTGDKFKYGYVKTLGIGSLSKDYGVSIRWEFITSGPLQYNYTVPFTAHFGFPMSVYPGQRIYLESDFTWGGWNPRRVESPPGPTYGVDQNYEYSHKSSVWFDAPDGLGETETDFTQEADKARIRVKIPVLPLMNSIQGTWDCEISPCNEGGGDWGGNYTRLGGQGELTSSLVRPYEETDKSISLLGTAFLPSAWSQRQEQFELVSEALQMIPSPVTIGAGIGLGVVKDIGGFKLDIELHGKIERVDTVNIEILQPSLIVVPEDIQGDVWRFDMPVNIPYRTKFKSFFSYPLEFRIVFDMVTIDPVTIVDKTLFKVAGNPIESNWITQQGTFNVAGMIPVEPIPSRFPTQTTAARPQLATRATPSLPKEVANARLARINDTQRIVRASERVLSPQPFAPRSRQFTVVIGRYPDAEANSVIENLARQQVEAISIPVPGSTDKIVSVGSFSAESDANIVSAMLKELLNVSSVVTNDPFANVRRTLDRRRPMKKKE